jgi:signal transduction histidine kinase
MNTLDEKTAEHRYWFAFMGIIASLCIIIAITALLGLKGWILALLAVALFIAAAFAARIIGKRYAAFTADRISAAHQSEESFIHHASHELNNPLTAIQGECEISLMKERTPQQYQAALVRIITEAKRINQLMKSLLFLSKSDSEIQEGNHEMVFLADFLMQFADKRISFSADNFAYCFEANPNLLKIAIGNILNNACKYSGEEIVEMRLRASTLEIMDRGIGIPPEELNRIQQPFYRASNTRDYAGKGLGLSLSIRILKIYGAEVHLDSVLGQGTTVTIDFP